MRAKNRDDFSAEPACKSAQLRALLPQSIVIAPNPIQSLPHYHGFSPMVALDGKCPLSHPQWPATSGGMATDRLWKLPGRVARLV